ncbi:hypothetical protein IQ06DRAFT_97249 [Phaeosphaeriaceae sp. SRC1lsM3a]|nr:hypothetical protein IQ06DRAFT_97249 [Stagonospora sp. SRC1lsM3a]
MLSCRCSAAFCLFALSIAAKPMTIGWSFGCSRSAFRADHSGLCFASRPKRRPLQLLLVSADLHI